MVNKQFFGIDFGTTSSAVVNYVIDIDGKTKQYKYGDDLGRPIPSVVAIDRETGEVHTGREAKSNRLNLSERCEYVSSVKTFLDNKDWKRTIGGKEWTPVDIAAEVFKTLKHEVSLHKTELDTAIVAIPIDFSAEKRNEVRAAAQIAGIRIKDFVSEPTAAFYANYDDLKEFSTVAVFDWGGGTLDVSVLAHHDGRIEELATAGLPIAGDDIDLKLARRLHTRFCRQKNVHIPFEDMPASARDRLIEKAENAKIHLSEDDEVPVSVLKYGDLGAVRTTIDIEWFREVITPEIKQAVDCLSKAIAESQVGVENIEAILLVGGSSGLLPLQELIQERFPSNEKFMSEENMWNVGDGAARLARNGGSYFSSQNLGLKLADGSTYYFLHKDEPVEGWKRTASFALADTSSEIRLVMTGSEDLHEGNIIDIDGYNFLFEKIEIKAEIDTNRIFRLEAKSNFRPACTKALWDYGKLKFYFKLPRDGEKNVHNS